MDMNDLFGDYQNGNYSSQAKEGHPLQQNDFSYGHENDNVKGKKPKQKKKGGGFKIFLLLVLILAIAAGGAYVYLFTDTFRTPKELMVKYMMLMVAESEGMTPISTQIMEKETGTATVDAKLTLLLEETSDGYMDDVNVNVDFDIDYDKSQSEIKIDTEIEEQKYDFSILTNKNAMAIGSSLVDISEEYNGAKYVGIKNENLKDFAKKFEVDSETLKMIPDSINFDGLKEIFTEEEIADISMRYLEILNTHLPEEKFAVEEKVATLVDGNNYETKKVSIKLTSTEVLEILLAGLEELKNDTVILNCYKKVVDIEIPEKTVNEYFDEMITGLKETIEEDKEAPAGTMDIAMYIYDKAAIKIQVAILDEEAALLDEITYSSVKTKTGHKIITEAFSPGGEYSPDMTEKNSVEVALGPTSDKVIYTAETIYGEMKETEDDSFSSFFSSSYEDSKSEVVYEIKDFSSKGYNDNLVASEDGVDIIKFVSTVKFDEKVSAPELTKDNTVFINDLSLEEMETLMTTIESKLEALMPEDDYSYDYEDDLYSDDMYSDDFIDSDDSDYVTNEVDSIMEFDDTTNTVTNTVTNEIDYSRYEDLYNMNVEDTSENESDTFDTLSDELKNALTTCEVEAAKTEYVLHDYLNVDNLKALCSSIENIELLENTDTNVSFTITAGGEIFEYSVSLDGDSSTGETLSLR